MNPTRPVGSISGFSSEGRGDGSIATSAVPGEGSGDGGRYPCWAQDGYGAGAFYEDKGNSGTGFGVFDWGLFDNNASGDGYGGGYGATRRLGRSGDQSTVSGRRRRS